MRSTQAIHTSGLAAPTRLAWLSQRVEEPLLPDVPIIDAHHHLWDRLGDRYMLDEYLSDVHTGHRIAASVYVECRSMYRAGGPESFRTVGEIEFANGMAAVAASGNYGTARVCAAIVGHLDLRLGEDVRLVLNAMERSGGGRFRGIRHVSAWDADERVTRPFATRPPGLLLDPQFRRGFAVLGAAGCSFDAFLFHPQLGELVDLAASFPDTSIILNHCGGPAGIGGYAGRRDAVFSEWRKGIRAVAACNNVSVKLSGLGMRLAGFDFHERPLPPTSEELAAAWQPYVEACIEAFGVQRCMFASNFSPDKGTCAYATLWNAFKRICRGASSDEMRTLFYDTAKKIYRIEDIP